MMEETMGRTAFARVVFGEILTAKGIPAEDPAAVRELAEEAGLDPEGLVALMTGEPHAGYPGDLGALDDHLWLTTEQMELLAWAYTYDRDIVGEAVLRAETFDDAFAVVLGASRVPPDERQRVLALLTEERGKAQAEADRLEASLRGARTTTS